MKKVGLFLGVAPWMGGVYQYSQCLLEAFLALPADRYERVVHYTDPLWADALTKTGVRAIRVGCPRWTFGLGAAVTLSGLPVPLWQRVAPWLDPAARRMKAAQCDLWLISSFSSVSYQMPVPSVGVIHDLMHRYERHFPRDSSAFNYFWRERVFRRMGRYTQALFVDSKLGREQVVESYGVDPGKIHVLPFVPPKHVLNAGAPTGFDARYPLPAKFLFYPAQFWQHKNHARLFRAVAGLRDALPDLHLVLAGGKNREYERLATLATSLGVADRITFTGYVPDADMAELYRRARALVFPSFYGPTNIPPLEAFVLGCPVAASGIYAMPEQLGDAALLFDPTSEKALADAVRRLWTDDALCDTLVARGKARAAELGQERFSARFARNLQAILAGVG